MRIDKKIRSLLDEARIRGGRDLAVVRGRKHPKLTGYTPGGERFALVFAGSPSCYRAHLNARARLRRVLRGDVR